jgi:hypothetical protein
VIWASRDEVLPRIAAEALLLVNTPQEVLMEFPDEFPVVFLALLWSSNEEKKSSALRFELLSMCAGGIVLFLGTDSTSSLTGTFRGRLVELLVTQPDFLCLT